MRLIQKHAGLGLKVISDCLQEDICFGRCLDLPEQLKKSITDSIQSLFRACQAFSFLI